MDKRMQMAIELVHPDAREGEVPVGCVIACEGGIVGRGAYLRDQTRGALGHAEMTACE